MNSKNLSAENLPRLGSDRINWSPNPMKSHRYRNKNSTGAVKIFHTHVKRDVEADRLGGIGARRDLVTAFCGSEELAFSLLEVPASSTWWWWLWFWNGISTGGSNPMWPFIAEIKSQLCLSNTSRDTSISSTPVTCCNTNRAFITSPVWLFLSSCNYAETLHCFLFYLKF